MDERQLESAARKALDGDRPGAVGTLLNLVVALGTGHPLLGLLAEKGAEKVASAVLDGARENTRRFLAAGAHLDDERAHIDALVTALREELTLFGRSELEELDSRDNERFVRIIRYVERAVASSGDQLKAEIQALRAEVGRVLAVLSAGAPSSRAFGATNRGSKPRFSSRGILPREAATYVWRRADHILLERVQTTFVARDAQFIFLSGGSGSGKSSMTMQLGWPGSKWDYVSLEALASSHRETVQERLCRLCGIRPSNDTADIVRATRGQPCLLILDEFGALHDRELKQMMHMLSSLQAAEICVVACALDGIEKLLVNEAQPRWRHMWSSINLDQHRFDAPEVDQLLSFLPTEHHHFVHPCLDQIVARTAGLPLAVQLLCHELEQIQGPNQQRVHAVIKSWYPPH